MLEILASIFIYGVPLLLAIPLHEAAHGFVARHYGDPTAERLGRVTLKPWRHIDPVGTVILPLALILSHSPIVFGWAKPVPVNFANLRDPRWDSLKVAIAGPGMNLVLAVITVLLWKISQIMAWEPDIWISMLVFSLLINLALMVLNMFPILPLDGGRVLYAILPAPLAEPYGKLERYGMMIVLLVIFLPVIIAQFTSYDFSVVRWVLAPAVLWCMEQLITLFQIQL